MRASPLAAAKSKGRHPLGSCHPHSQHGFTHCIRSVATAATQFECRAGRRCRCNNGQRNTPPRLAGPGLPHMPAMPSVLPRLRQRSDLVAKQCPARTSVQPRFITDTRPLNASKIQNNHGVPEYLPRYLVSLPAVHPQQVAKSPINLGFALCSLAHLLAELRTFSAF